MARRPIAANPVGALGEESQEGAAGVTALATETAEETRQVAPAADGGAGELPSTIEDAKLKFNQGMTSTMKTAEEVLAFSQGNVEAFIKSGQIWTTGLQDLSKQWASSAQSSYEEAVAAFKALTTVKSLKEAVDLQVGLTRSVIEKGVAESNKYTDASFKLAEQAIAPLSSRVTLAVETFGKSV